MAGQMLVHNNDDKDDNHWGPGGEEESGNGGCNSMTCNDEEEAPPPLSTTLLPSQSSPNLKGSELAVPPQTAAVKCRERLNLASSFPTKSGPGAGLPLSPFSDHSSLSSGSNSSSSDFTLVDVEETYTSSLFQTEPLYQFYDKDHVSNSWV